MGILPGTTEGQGGAVVKWEESEPSAQGVTIYLNGGDDLSVPLGRVEKAGGKIVMPKTNVAEKTYVAMFIDTEGNRVGLLSSN